MGVDLCWFDLGAEDSLEEPKSELYDSLRRWDFISERILIFGYICS